MEGADVEALAETLLGHAPQALDLEAAGHVGQRLARDREVYEYMTRAGVLDGSFDYEGFMTLVERALEEEIDNWNGGRIEELDPVMEQLGIMPFDEASLPPEDPATY